MARVLVRFEGQVLADTGGAIALEDSGVSAYYIPRRDVRMERLERTSYRTHCPLKGDASYYSIKDGPDNVAWSYEAPYDETLAIKGLLAFSPDKVEVWA